METMSLLTVTGCSRCKQLKNEFPEIEDPKNDAIIELSMHTVNGVTEAAFFDVRAAPALVVWDPVDPDDDYAILDFENIRKKLKKELKEEKDQKEKP